MDLHRESLRNLQLQAGSSMECQKEVCLTEMENQGVELVFLAFSCKKKGMGDLKICLKYMITLPPN